MVHKPEFLAPTGRTLRTEGFPPAEDMIRYLGDAVEGGAPSTYPGSVAAALSFMERVGRAPPPARMLEEPAILDRSLRERTACGPTSLVSTVCR